MLEALRCNYCEGHINPETLRCDYCGTQYREEKQFGQIHYIQTCPASVTPLSAQVAIDDYAMNYMSPEQIAEYSMKHITRTLAEALAPYVKLETQHDLATNRQIIRGSIRVVEPDFRF